MFARSRKERVIGRTIILINSTRHKNGIRYQGELEGKTADAIDSFTSWINTPINQQARAALILKLNVVVTG
jgi:hypothetical protein